MNIKILFFGITTDITGSNTDTITFKKNTSVKDLKSVLILKYPNLKNIDDFAIAINEEYAEDDTILQLNDVVAIIPPVSGG
ncbi:MAG: MoaD/ThiS family protein [Lutibacter sp.]